MASEKEAKQKSGNTNATVAAVKPKKLSYKFQRELDELPKKIDKLETSINLVQQKMAEPGFYQMDPNEVTKTANELTALQNELAACFARWEALEA